MKAKDLNSDGSELQHKVRTVSDLIRHIKTRESDSETANYNLFFGAGCSVSSGVRTAKQLIEEWIYDLYERFNSTEAPSTEEALRFFENNHSNWYSKENIYSSLFEKTYEFASQRRRFVEREVDKALPAIGYAYLTSLVSQRYFNTIFTTNFDDLLNEAFYQFSNERPILCAHDSSIKSISITSTRPKIIKLHGDYLFDDIKSTLRETESLEQNTKEKLIEFCKEFGLIVIGYSGNDRSIMDVLDFLTKQENYLKNGVYWCLRKDDEINHVLQNLFWKEKVYPVIIDGFDELFAEIHAKLVGIGLDFSQNLKSSKLQQIKNKILDENNPINLNRYISTDIRKIKDTNNQQEISEFLSALSNSGESDGLSLNELRNLLEIEDLIKKSEFEKAYKLAEEFYYQADETTDKARFISMLISISDSKGDTRGCLTWCDRLVELDPNNSSYMIKKSEYLNELSTKYSYLDEKTKNHDLRYELHNATARAGFKLIKNDPSNTLVDENKLINHLDTSLNLDPSLSNSAWYTKLEILNSLKLKYKKNSNMESMNEFKDKILNHVESARVINKDSLVTLRLELQSASHTEDFDKTKQVIDQLYCKYNNSDLKNKIKVNETLNEAFRFLSAYNSKADILKLKKSFYENHLLDKNIKSNSTLLLSKGKYFISNGNQLDKAESYFLSALDCSDLYRDFEIAIFVNKCLNYKYTNKLLGKLEKDKSKILEQYYYEYKYELSIALDDHTHALKYLEKSYAFGLPMDSYYSNLSYLLLLSKDHQRLLDIESTNSKKLQNITSEAFIINFQFAAKCLNDKHYDPVILRNIVANTKDHSIWLAAYSVLDQEVDVKRILSEEINKSFDNYYIYSSWPIIPKEYLDEYKQSKAA